MCRDCSVAAKLPIHNFVNDLDVMPYLLHPASVKSLLEALQPVLPTSVQRILGSDEVHAAGSFIDVGNTYLMLGKHIQTSVRNRHDQAAASMHLSDTLSALVNTTAAQDMAMICVMHDHLPSAYSAKLQDAAMCCIPILFRGGAIDSYEAVRIKRMSVGNTAPLMYCCQCCFGFAPCMLCTALLTVKWYISCDMLLQRSQKIPPC